MLITILLIHQPLRNLLGVSHPMADYLKGTAEIWHLSLQGCGSDPVVKFVPCGILETLALTIPHHSP